MDYLDYVKHPESHCGCRYCEGIYYENYGSYANICPGIDGIRESYAVMFPDIEKLLVRGGGWEQDWVQNLKLIYFTRLKEITFVQVIC